MILNFSFKNYLSFRDAQQFSFEPISGKKEFGPVRVAAVYGANASGKSNFIDALILSRISSAPASQQAMREHEFQSFLFY